MFAGCRAWIGTQIRFENVPSYRHLIGQPRTLLSAPCRLPTGPLISFENNPPIPSRRVQHAPEHRRLFWSMNRHRDPVVPLLATLEMPATAAVVAWARPVDGALVAVGAVVCTVG